MTDLTERDQRVLEAVVNDHIQSGEPVGSRTVSKRYGLKVSSATVRNIMADLEEMGYLYQPHTSAGRIPTEKGLRLYLDSLMKSKAIEEHERALIRKALVETQRDLKELLHRTTQLLSGLCRQAAVVLWPKLSLTRLKHIEFIRLRPNQIMVIVIAKTGLVQHTVMEWEEDIGQDELDKYGRYLNELFADVPLGEVKERILQELHQEKVLFDQLLSRALNLTSQVFQDAFNSSDVYIEGRTNLLNNPEFADVERMRRVLDAFEDKSRIIRLLDMTLQMSRGVHIILGPESELRELNEISLISSQYTRGGTPLGVVGVMGPMRMDYSRIIPIVEFTADLLGQLLEEHEGR